MKTLFLNFFFPLHCLVCGREGALACQNCRLKISPADNPDQITKHQIYSTCDYRDPLVAALVQALKYRGWKVAATEMTELMFENSKSEAQSPLSRLEMGGEATKEKIILVPVPLS